jgi:hypothetical protein
MRGTVSFLSYTFRQLQIKPYRAVCLLKKLAGMTVHVYIKGPAAAAAHITI